MTDSFVNKKVYHDYKILEEYEAGIALIGQEIKAIRAGRVNLTGSYVKVVNGEVFWIGGMIESALEDPQRTRKLLLKAAEIKKLIGKTSEQGQTIVPLKLYLKRGRAKLLIGLAKGLKKYDKREIAKKKDQAREIARTVK